MTKEEQKKKTEQAVEQVVEQAAKQTTENSKPIGVKVEKPSQVVQNANAKTEQLKAETLTPKENAIDRLLNERIKQSEAEGKQIASQDPDSPEQVKRRKRNALIASIADGLSSMATMYSVAKGAPAPSAIAPTLSEVQKAQNVKDRNTYLELLQSWRKRNNELLNSYADYQSTIAKSKLASDKLDFERDREARLYAKDEAQRAYQAKLIELKQQGADDLKAHREAQLAYKEKELEARREYWAQQNAINQQRVDKMGRNSTTTYTYKMEQGKPVRTGKQTTYGGEK